MKYRILRLSLASLLIGAAMVPAMPPWNLWPCAFVGFSLFYLLLSRVQTRRGAVLYGWLFGFGYFGVGLYWIANALLVPGNPFKWFWPLTIAGLPALLAWFPAFGAVLCQRYPRQRLAGYLSFVAAFGLSEWLRGHILSGYPWNSYGYAWASWLSVAQTAAFGGTYFLTLLTVAWASLPGFLWLWHAPRRPRLLLALVAILSFGVCWTFGAWRLAHHPTVFNDRVALRPVQADISQADKWNPAKAGENLKRELDLSLPDDADHAATTVLIWPETALDQDAMSYPQVTGALRDLLRLYPGDVYLMTGMLRWNTDAQGHEHNFNSFVVFDKKLQSLAIYNKSHLVPFGEYIPLQNILHMKPFVRFDGFDTGNGPQTFAISGLPAFTPLICYEVIFPGGVIAREGSRPAWLINITNDAWYGDSPGPPQHFAQAQFRAIEEGVPIVRAAATGVSGVVDSYGRVLARLPVGVAGTPTVHLPTPASEPTLYSRLHDIFVLVSILLIAAAARWSIRKDRRITT